LDSHDVTTQKKRHAKSVRLFIFAKTFGQNRTAALAADFAAAHLSSETH
jgi:hypothetical protein